MGFGNRRRFGAHRGEVTTVKVLPRQIPGVIMIFVGVGCIIAGVPIILFDFVNANQFDIASAQANDPSLSTTNININPPGPILLGGGVFLIIVGVIYCRYMRKKPGEGETNNETDKQKYPHGIPQGPHPQGRVPQGPHPQGHHPQGHPPQGPHPQGPKVQAGQPQGYHPQPPHPQRQGGQSHGSHQQRQYPQTQQGIRPQNQGNINKGYSSTSKTQHGNTRNIDPGNGALPGTPDAIVTKNSDPSRKQQQQQQQQQMYRQQQNQHQQQSRQQHGR